MKKFLKATKTNLIRVHTKAKVKSKVKIKAEVTLKLKTRVKVKAKAKAKVKVSSKVEAAFKFLVKNKINTYSNSKVDKPKVKDATLIGTVRRKFKPKI